MERDLDFKKISDEWLIHSFPKKYQSRFSWLGFPILQFPADILAVQEVIWAVQPKIIIETGVFKGGSVMFSASLLKLMGGERKVIGIDISFSPGLKESLQNNPLSDMIMLIEGSSTDEKVKTKVTEILNNKLKTRSNSESSRQETVSPNVDSDAVMVLLDASHTHDHVLQELNFYSNFVTKGSYLIVFDTILEDFPKAFLKERPWGKGNSPRTALQEFLKHNDRFEIDETLGEKLQITANPDGYLKCVK